MLLMKKLLLLTGVACFAVQLFAQTITPELSKINDGKTWKIYNRSVATGAFNKQNSVHFEANQGDGLAIYQDLEFENGTIEFDVKGKDVLQQSFVGVAFHIQNDSTFNAIYFRPFNFKKPERASHSVQYISHPKFTWQKLRSEFPEQFEKTVTPVPNPYEFFHARIDVKWPTVKVYVENSEIPSLEVKMLSSFKKGKVGLWVGNGSDGSFKNLKIKQ
jgi:hypothetical protein